MRTLSTAAQSKIAQQFGAEPVNIVEVQWAADGNRFAYADKDLPNIPGRILDMGDVDFIIDVNNGSDSTEVSIVLSDIDGTLKNIIDTNDVHKRSVWVYQWFPDLDLDDKFLVFRGQINSPIVWNEGDRTLSFTIISQIEDAEIGFSLEEGRAFTYDPSLIGKAWPLKFGTTINVPALRASAVFKGTLGTGTGIVDFWLSYKANQQLTCPQVFTGFELGYVAGQPAVIPAYYADPSCTVKRCEVLRKAEFQLAEQSRYEFDTIEVIGGEKFIQGEQITLDIDGALFTGSFSGTTFTITKRVHPDFDELGPATDAKLKSLLDAEEAGVKLGCGQANEAPSNSKYRSSSNSRLDVQASELSWNKFNAIPEPGFFWAAAGTTVLSSENSEVVYISNLVPETVIKVMAYRTLDNLKQLITVPEDFYTTRTTDFNGYMVSEIVFEKPMSRIDDTWEDDIYVTSTSTVGPNTVDIMEWLIDKYTTLTVDTASFTAVKALLENYPMDFPYLTRKNLIAALQELAFQARCAIYLRDGVFYLKYLSRQDTAVDTFVPADIDANTLELYHTPTEDLVTKFVANWKRDYSKSEDNTVILRHNVERYGVQEGTYDFYAYNELPYVHKSATFWLIRKANTWRKIKFTTPIHKLELETFDPVNLTLPTVNPGTIPGVIQQADYNSNDHSMVFDIWTPVKSGTTVAYDFAFPANISQELFWPTDEEFADGSAGSGISAPGFSVIAPAGHPLALPQGYQGISEEGCPSQTEGSNLTAGSEFNNLRDRGCGSDNGDKKPSDADDSKIDKNIEDASSPDLSVPPGDVYKTQGAKLAEAGAGESKLKESTKTANDAYGKSLSSEQEASYANEAASGQGSGTNNPTPGPENLPSSDELKEQGDYKEGDSECLFYANVFIAQAVFVAGPDGGSDQGDTGFIGVTSDVRQDVLTFATCIEAQQMVCSILKAFQARQDAKDIKVGEQIPINANSICPLYNPPCSATPDPGVPGPVIIGYESYPSTNPDAPTDKGETDYIGQALAIAISGECG